MERYTRAKIDMRYGSPDVIRPNKELEKKTINKFGLHPNKEHLEKIREDFNKKFNVKSTQPRLIPQSSLPRNTNIPPSPKQLPMPSQRLLSRKKDHSKSPKPLEIQGRNRKWTIKNIKSSTPRTRSKSRTRSNKEKKGGKNELIKQFKRIRKP